MESAPPLPSPEPEVLLFDSVFAYRDYLRSALRRTLAPAAVRTIQLDHGDGDISIYDAAGTFLACEEGPEAALHEARFVLSGFANGAVWAEREMAQECRPSPAALP